MPHTCIKLTGGPSPHSACVPLWKPWAQYVWGTTSHPIGIENRDRRYPRACSQECGHSALLRWIHFQTTNFREACGLFFSMPRLSFFFSLWSIPSDSQFCVARVRVCVSVPVWACVCEYLRAHWNLQNIYYWTGSFIYSLASCFIDK